MRGANRFIPDFACARNHTHVHRQTACSPERADPAISLAPPSALQIYVRIPLPASNGSLQRNLTATAVGTLWLRRLGGGQAGRYALPHQLPDSIRGFLWLDDPNNFTLAGPTSHASMPVRQDQWQPHLLLDTVAGGPPLRAVVDPVRGLGDTEARPYTFTFHLPQNAGNCFKVCCWSRVRTCAVTCCVIRMRCTWLYQY